jgi:hypothetical protein
MLSAFIRKCLGFLIGFFGSREAKFVNGVKYLRLTLCLTYVKMVAWKMGKSVTSGGKAYAEL